MVRCFMANALGHYSERLLQANQLDRARLEALSLQHGVPVEFAQLIPQMMVLSVLCYAVWLIRKRLK